MKRKDKILEGIDRYYQPNCFLNESVHETKVINGIPHTVMNCTVEEYIQRTGAKKMEDVKWS